MITTHGNSAPGQIIFFGDSLTDDGNFRDLAGLVVDDASVLPWVGPTGSASNGPTHATHTANILGIPWQNYSVIAAEVTGVQDITQLADQFGFSDNLVVPPESPLLDVDINLAGQVDRFLEDNAGQDLSDTTALLFIGVNDYGAVNLQAENPFLEVLKFTSQIMDGLSANAARLAAAGVGNIKLVPLPSAEFLAGATLVDDQLLLAANLLFSIHNTQLERTVEKLADSGMPVDLLQFTAISQALIDDPRSFGFIAPPGVSLTDEGVEELYDPDQVFAADIAHPSTDAQVVLGAFTAFNLSGGKTTELTDRTNFHVAGFADDLVVGLGGHDIIYGGPGSDILLGGTGNDILWGQRGDDLLSGGADNDRLRGGLGNDILAGGEGDDKIWGGPGDDLLIGGLGNNDLDGGRDDDTFIYVEPTLIGGTDGDTNTMNGGRGQDQLILVLDSERYALLAEDLEGDAPTDALASLGITTRSIESIVVVEGRDGLEVFDDAPWYADADIWGLI